jgi:hypothetical protein
MPKRLERYLEPFGRQRMQTGIPKCAGVTLDEAGRATDTLVISESPLGMGFGAAASELAHVFKYANRTGRSASVTYRIKFELDRSGGPDPSSRQSGS